jgi:SAM-dependent methyltransferase
LGVLGSHYNLGKERDMANPLDLTLADQPEPWLPRLDGQFKIPTQPKFVCPIDRHPLLQDQASLVCQHCHTAFPIVGGVPVLINEANSLFVISDYIKKIAFEGASGYGGSVDKTSGWRRVYRRLTSRLVQAEVPGSNVNALERIQAENPEAQILVVGAGERRFAGNITYTDVALANGISCICDAHDLPFEDGSFDAVIADSVLEHVLDPHDCVAEFVRVLRPRGYVMAVTPFLQPVHMRAYDFTRFTYLGHRRLFRHFDDIQSGMCGGPVYSAIHLMRTIPIVITAKPKLQAVTRLAILLVAYVLRKADPFFSRHQNAYDAACATYFFGRKRATAIPDKEILLMFRGH